jgi:hypothetical protein
MPGLSPILASFASFYFGFLYFCKSKGSQNKKAEGAKAQVLYTQAFVLGLYCLH